MTNASDSLLAIVHLDDWREPKKSLVLPRSFKSPGPTQGMLYSQGQGVRKEGPVFPQFLSILTPSVSVTSSAGRTYVKIGKNPSGQSMPSRHNIAAWMLQNSDRHPRFHKGQTVKAFPLESRHPLEGSTDTGRSLPESWRAKVQPQLAANEPILAWFEPDLDHRLCFAERLVVLTDRRLLTYSDPEPNANSSAVLTNGSAAMSDGLGGNAEWQTFPHSKELELIGANMSAQGARSCRRSEATCPLAIYARCGGRGTSIRWAVQRCKKRLIQIRHEHLPKLRGGDYGGRRGMSVVQRDARASGDLFALSLDRVRQAADETDSVRVFADVVRNGD